jgi:hypothetical protein
MYIYDSSGNVTILIKAISNIDLLGNSYKEGDVIAFFENSYFELQFTNNNKTITKSPINLLHYNSISVSSILIHPKSVSHNLYSFIAASKKQDENILIPLKEEINTDSTGVAFFTRVPTNLKHLEIKDYLTRETITGYVVDYNTGQISGLQQSKKYLAFYYAPDISLISYDLKEVKTPYFKIEITGDNNTNGITRKMVLTLPKVSADLTTMLEFKQEALASADLRFIVIDGEASIVYY